jgi:hypothetical protein
MYSQPFSSMSLPARSCGCQRVITTRQDAPGSRRVIRDVVEPLPDRFARRLALGLDSVLDRVVDDEEAGDALAGERSTDAGREQSAAARRAPFESDFASPAICTPAVFASVRALRDFDRERSAE